MDAIDWSVGELLWVSSWLAACLTVPSVLIHRAGRPIAALSWLLALFALPFLSTLIWWCFGRTHLQRRRKRRREATEFASIGLRETRNQLDQLSGGSFFASMSALPVSQLPLALQGGVFPPTLGNNVVLLERATNAHQAWYELVEQANYHLHLLFYIWKDDEVGRTLRDQLVVKAQQGVSVRVLYDAVGSFGLPSDFFDALIQAGGKVAKFLPVTLLRAPLLNFRNHRKLLIADGHAAYTGGINVGDEYLAWQDIGITLSGAGVNQLQEVFVEDWFYCTGEELTDADYFCRYDLHRTVSNTATCSVIASGPDQHFNATREMVFLTITQARSRLWVATPYFIPDEALLLALRTAVYRGVDVRILVPRDSDSRLCQRASRAYYTELLEAGVLLYEYRGMLHAKATLIDNQGVLIGSANLDSRSFKLNFELSTVLSSESLCRQLQVWYEGLLASSDRVFRSDLDRVGYGDRMVISLAHLLSPLL